MKKTIKDVVIVIGTWGLSIWGLDTSSIYNSEKEKNSDYFIDNNYEIDYYKDVPINELLNKQVTKDNRETEKGRMSEEEQIQQLLLEREQYENAKKQNEIKYQQNLKKQRELERQEELKKIEEAKKAEAIRQQSKIHTTKNNAHEADWMTFEATYFTAKCKGCSGFTKLEIDVRNTIYYNGMRIVAVDPRVIPLESVIEIKSKNGTFKAYAGDVGGAIKGRKLDILVSTKKEAYNLGRHNVQLRILEYGNK